MAWVRIHDGAMQNMKISKLSDSAFRLWVRGLCYCQTALTDGLIPREALREMGAKRKDIDMLASVLVAGRQPLWEPHVIGFKVHDYLSWNDCREKVVERQEEARARKAAYDARKKAEREVKKGTRSERVTNAVPDAFGTGSSNQTKPNQTVLDPTDQEHIQAAFEQFWVAYPKHEGRKAAETFWSRLLPDSALTGRIVAAARAYARHVGDWKAQFIKAPIRWLEGAHWDDEVVGSAVQSADRECPHDPACASRTVCVARIVEAGRAERQVAVS